MEGDDSTPPMEREDSATPMDVSRDLSGQLPQAALLRAYFEEQVESFELDVPQSQSAVDYEAVMLHSLARDMIGLVLQGKGAPKHEEEARHLLADKIGIRAGEIRPYQGNISTNRDDTAA
jgi:hypothetical protein